ncbi:hypothetical protein DPX16_20475 [Anabarilius grahami]|uniref:Uncharacterized protein n=1 Tax=Anabarilius grahami TaxID=495550 RepID=A0A3N0Z4H0_ANAGA|nr:hypothetical protein DPX16_20475 [Anabarilius grahami]
MSPSRCYAEQAVSSQNPWPISCEIDLCQKQSVSPHTVRRYLLHYEGRDPADSPIPSMQQYATFILSFLHNGETRQPVTIKSRTGQTKLIKQWHV